jgi:transposase
MKRDGRKLDHKTLEEIRRMAVQRVWNGVKPSVVIASYGFSRQIIYNWLREARGKGRGLRTLISRNGTGHPRTLTPQARATIVFGGATERILVSTALISSCERG